MRRAAPRAAPGARARAPARSRRALAAAALSLAAAAPTAAFFMLPREPALVVADARGREIARVPVPDGRFSLVFTHSFHLTPVEERYAIERTGTRSASMRLYELRYQSSGVGMPADAEGGYRLEDGFFVLSMDRVLREIPILVSIVPGHGIVAGGTYLPFRNWAAPEGGIRLSARMSIAVRPWR